MARFLKLTQSGIVLFVVFAIIGFLGIFATGLRSNFSSASASNLLNQPFCNLGNHYEQYLANFQTQFFAPLFGVFYGKVCNKLLLYSFNLPYYYVLALVGDWLIAAFPVSKRK